MLAVSDMLLEQHGNLLRQGTILVDPADDGEEPHLLFLLTHEIKSGDDQVLSKRLQFVRVAPDGSAAFAGWAPHLDLEPLAPADRALLKDVLTAPWIRADQEQRALALAAATLVPEHFQEVAGRRIAHVDKTLAAVHERLTKEIAFWSDRWLKLKEDQEAGKDVRLNLENARRTVADLEGRLENRKKELLSMRHVTSATPVALGGALVIPAGLLRRLRGETSAEDGSAFSTDPVARARIEKLAMDAVRRRPRKLAAAAWWMSPLRNAAGISPPIRPPWMANSPKPATSRSRAACRARPPSRSPATKCSTPSTRPTNSFLAIVLVGEDDAMDGPYYLRNPFEAEPGWGVSSVNYDLKALLERRNRAMTYPIKSPRKLIEVALPLDAINAACARERNPSGMGILPRCICGGRGDRWRRRGRSSLRSWSMIPATSRAAGSNTGRTRRKPPSSGSGCSKSSKTSCCGKTPPTRKCWSAPAPRFAARGARCAS